MQGDIESWENTVYSESLAEGAETAILMVKHGNLKYTVSGLDPEQLYDLEFDPNEMNNLVENQDYTDSLQALAGKAKEKWDIEELSTRVSESQIQRMFVRQALKYGKVTSWDYCAPDQIVAHCLRGEKKYNDWAYDTPIGLNRLE